MNIIPAALMAIQASAFSASAGEDGCSVQPGGLSGVVSEIASLGSDRDFSPAPGADACGSRILQQTASDTRDILDTPVRVSAFSRLHRPGDGFEQSRALGFTLEVNSETVAYPSMAIVAGVDQRRVFLAPGIEGFQRPVVNLTDSLDVADGYGGIAWRLSPERFVSVSYVRQERSFNSGMSEWREQDHFVGFVFNQRW